MKCPYCDHQDDRVLDSRNQKEGESIRRRRECLACKGRFSTVESVLLSYPMVIKKDGRSQEFNKEKIVSGLQAACHKRPISSAQIEQMSEKITKWALESDQKEITSNSIGYKITNYLKAMDDVAYVRFASVYRTFKDVQEFVETLESPNIIQVSSQTNMEI